MSRFLDAMETLLARTHETPVLSERHEDGSRTLTAFELATFVAEIRGGLRARGVTAGERVGLVAANGLAWVAADLAIALHGAVCVPLYPRSTPTEIAYALGDAGCSLVLVDHDGRAAVLRTAGVRVPIASIDEVRGPAVFEARAARDDADTATLCYTSGTSGPPKGAMISWANVDAILPVTDDALSTMTGQPASEDVVYHYLPLCFMGSRIVLWTCLFRGTPVTLGTSIEAIAQDVSAVAPTYMLNVPILLERIKRGAVAAMTANPVGAVLYPRWERACERRGLGHASPLDHLIFALSDRLLFARVRARLGSRLRFLIVGSAPLSPATQQWFEAVGIQVFQVYGLTETTAILSMDFDGLARPGTVGRAITGAHLRLSDEGELQAQGPMIFQGYHGNEAASAEAFTPDGWFRTGDVAHFDGDRLVVEGRIKRVIVLASGHNVVAEPIEAAILDALPDLSHAVLTGHGASFLGVLLFGPCEPEAIEAALARVNAGLAHYKQVRAWWLRADPPTEAEGLLTANGKIKRKAFEQIFAPQIDQMRSR